MSTADLFGGDANPDSLGSAATRAAALREQLHHHGHLYYVCLLYTSDAADD